MANPSVNIFNNGTNAKFAQYSANIDRATNANNKGKLLTVEFHDGEVRTKTGFGWLFSKLRQIYYSVTSSSTRDQVMNAHYSELLKQNWEFLKSDATNAKPEYSDIKASRITNEKLALVGKVTRIFAKQLKNREPIERVRQEFKAWVDADHHDIPEISDFMAEIHTSGILYDLMFEEGSDTKQKIRVVAGCTDLSPKIRQLQEKIKQNYKEFFPNIHLEESTRKWVWNNDPASERNTLKPEEVLKTGQLLEILNLLPPELEQVHQIAKEAFVPITDMNIFNSLPAWHAHFQKACEAQGISSEVPIKDGVPLPNVQQLEVAFETGYALFSEVPQLETPASQAFFARTIQYILLGDKVAYVPYPQDSCCFTTLELQNAKFSYKDPLAPPEILVPPVLAGGAPRREELAVEVVGPAPMLKAKSKFEIHEHDNFFVWLLKGNPKEQDPQKVMNDYLKGFFKDVAHRKGFAEFILKRPDGSKEDFSHINTNPNEFKKFLETYQSDFIGGVNWQNQLENLRKFEERVGFKLPTRENFGTFIDTVEPTIVPVVNAFKTVLKSNANFTDTQWEKIQLQNPQLKREEAENVWRLAILQMMMVTNNSLAGINPGEGIPLALFGADLKVELIHLPKPAIILITPFNIEVSQQKGDGLVKNLITPENGSRPDLSADKNTIVPFLLYDTRISIQDFNVFSKSNHTVVTHYSNLRMAPHAVNFLENMALALTTDASDPKRKLAKPAPTPDPVKDRYRGLPSFVADFDIIQKKVDLSLAAETVLEQAAAQDTYVPIGSVEEREIAVQWLNLKPTLNAFVEELELLWPKFKPYCIQTPEGLQIKPEYLPRVGEDPGIPYETLMELERFLPILNAYPVAKIGLLKKIGTQFTQDSSISTYAEIRTNYISRASAAKIPLEIQFNSANPKEIIPTNTQLTLASECARDFFKGGVAFETRAAQEFYGRIVQFALVGDPTFKTLDPVLEGFSTVELRAAPAVTLEVYRHTSFLDWYIQEVNPKTRGKPSQRT